MARDSSRTSQGNGLRSLICPSLPTSTSMKPRGRKVWRRALSAAGSVSVSTTTSRKARGAGSRSSASIWRRNSGSFGLSAKTATTRLIQRSSSTVSGGWAGKIPSVAWAAGSGGVSVPAWPAGCEAGCSFVSAACAGTTGAASAPVPALAPGAVAETASCAASGPDARMTRQVRSLRIKGQSSVPTDIGSESRAVIHRVGICPDPLPLPVATGAEIPGTPGRAPCHGTPGQ